MVTEQAGERVRKRKKSQVSKETKYYCQKRPITVKRDLLLCSTTDFLESYLYDVDKSGAVKGQFAAHTTTFFFLGRRR